MKSGLRQQKTNGSGVSRNISGVIHRHPLGWAKGAGSSLFETVKSSGWQLTGPISIFLRVTTLNDAFLLVFELFGSRHGIRCAIARVAPASYICGRRRAGTIRTVHCGVLSEVVDTNISRRIQKIKGT
jgi:hypothetical protein